MFLLLMDVLTKYVRKNVGHTWINDIYVPTPDGCADKICEKERRPYLGQ